jgi:hypothetical protein
MSPLAYALQMADTFFAAAAPLGKPSLAWTVDTPELLHRAAEAGLNSVVSNFPLELRGVLMDWRDRCSERQRRTLLLEQGRQRRQLGRREQGRESH